MTLMRLQRALARAGVTSRRKAEELIRAGRVKVDGAVAVLGQSVDAERQRVTVDGRVVRPARTVWLALNKPIGYVVSRGDPEGRPTVFHLLPKVPGLTYVGRLDVMTSGLLLLTTDGAAAHGSCTRALPCRAPTGSARTGWRRPRCSTPSPAALSWTIGR